MPHTFLGETCTADAEKLRTRVKANFCAKGKNRNTAFYFIRFYKCQRCTEAWSVLVEPHLPLAAGGFFLPYTKPYEAPEFTGLLGICS